MVSNLSEIWSGLFIPDSDFLPIPDPGVKKTPDPGSTSLKFYKKLQNKVKFLHKFCRFPMKMPFLKELSKTTNRRNVRDSVADPDPGSGIRCFLTPGSGIGFFRISDPGSQDHIFKSFLTVFLVKSSITLWKLAQIFFFSTSKLTIFWNLWLHKKVWQLIFFHLSLLLLFLDPGSEIRDLGSGMGKNQDPGSGINIPDPPHWFPKCFRPSSTYGLFFRNGNSLAEHGNEQGRRAAGGLS